MCVPLAMPAWSVLLQHVVGAQFCRGYHCRGYHCTTISDVCDTAVKTKGLVSVVKFQFGIQAGTRHHQELPIAGTEIQRGSRLL
jgi:hypothetical protein